MGRTGAFRATYQRSFLMNNRQQTFGGRGQSDGRLLGNETVQTVECDQTANTCSVQVPAPGAALVFFTPTAAEESSPSSTQTFATTAVTRTVNTATVAPSVVATSNGHNAANRSKSRLGSTSYGSSSGTAGRAGLIPGMITLTAGFAGIAIVRRLFVS